MKNNDKNLNESQQVKSYKKKFLLRKHQEVEAEEEIKQFVEDVDDYPQLDNEDKRPD